MLRAAGGVSPIQVLARSAVPVSAAADTNENTLATVSVPAGGMGPNGVLRITTRWAYTNSANTKTLRVRFSGVGGTAFASASITTNSGATLITAIANINSASSQKALSNADGTLGFTGTPNVTATVDTSQATTIVITGQKASAGEQLTLEGYVVELMYGA